MIQQNSHNVIDIWNTSLSVDNKMRHITVEELLRHIDNVGMSDEDWRQYIYERYGV